LGARVAIAALLLAAVAGCWIDESPFQPTPCGPGRTCPAFYTCVDDPPGTPICQAAYPPSRPDAAVPPKGPFRDYCHDAYPLFERYCVECHGPDQQLGVLRFRLDFYETDAGFIGARPLAPFIRTEVFVFRTMPPQDAPLFPTLAERLTIAEWVDAGAPFCAAVDAGTPDGGMSDGGDGG
jgi:hypothetical protein